MKDRPNPLYEILRASNTPCRAIRAIGNNPNVGVEQKTHSAQRLPFALSFSGGDNVSDDLNGASH